MPGTTPGMTTRAERDWIKKEKDRPKGPVFDFKSISVDQSFLFAAAAVLLMASLVASLASPMAFWPLPLIS